MPIFNIQNRKFFSVQEINRTEYKFLYTSFGMLYTIYVSYIDISKTVHFYQFKRQFFAPPRHVKSTALECSELCCTEV
jgi:hypothetical protein